ncbi:MAG: hypothetical protein IPF95_03895 [Flavobacteriales bacterium]|nr:hypothetical protein [Flavobacteriales bacterium]
MWDQQIGSEMEFLQIKSQMEQAEAGLAAMREQQRLSNITAPFSGQVDEIMLRVGDMASPMQPVARVVNERCTVGSGYSGELSENDPNRSTCKSFIPKPE